MGGLDRNEKQFRGGLVVKAHRLCVSLNSRPESNEEEARRNTFPSVSRAAPRAVSTTSPTGVPCSYEATPSQDPTVGLCVGPNDVRGGLTFRQPPLLAPDARRPLESFSVGTSQFENNYTAMCSGSEAGSYLRLIDFVYHITSGLRVIKKKREVFRFDNLPYWHQTLVVL